MPSEFIQRQKNDFFRDSSALGSLLLYCFLLIFLFLIKEFYLFKRLFFGFVLIYAATILTRTFYFKERPKRFNYNSYIEKLDTSSFPSLHASRMAFLGLILSKYFHNHIFTAIMVVLILAKPSLWWWYAIACTFGSVLGGCFGYSLGYFGKEMIIQRLVSLLIGMAVLFQKF